VKQLSLVVVAVLAGAIIYSVVHETKGASARLQPNTSSAHLGDAESAVVARLGKPDNQQHMQGVDFFRGRINTTDFLWYGRYQLVFENGTLTAKNKH
jgi:hypothetical protein